MLFVERPQARTDQSLLLPSAAQPENEVKTEEVPLRPLSPEPVPVACCVSSEGRPPAKISWPHLDEKANESQVPGHLPGTFTVTSLLTLIPSSQADGKTVTCRVEHESLEEPVLLPVTLDVPCECPPNVCKDKGRYPTVSNPTPTLPTRAPRTTTTGFHCLYPASEATVNAAPRLVSPGSPGLCLHRQPTLSLPAPLNLAYTHGLCLLP